MYLIRDTLALRKYLGESFFQSLFYKAKVAVLRIDQLSCRNHEDMVGDARGNKRDSQVPLKDFQLKNS